MCLPRLQNPALGQRTAERAQLSVTVREAAGTAAGESRPPEGECPSLSPCLLSRNHAEEPSEGQRAQGQAGQEPRPRGKRRLLTALPRDSLSPPLLSLGSPTSHREPPRQGQSEYGKVRAAGCRRETGSVLGSHSESVCTAKVQMGSAGPLSFSGSRQRGTYASQKWLRCCSGSSDKGS